MSLTNPKYSPLLAVLEEALATTEPADCPAVIGELERLTATLWGRMLTASNANPAEPRVAENRLLKAGEAAQKLGMSQDYLYRHADKLPFTVRPAPRQLRFSLNGIERYIRRRQGQYHSS